MLTSNELFLAILSMDSYNRGYNEGIEGLGGVGSLIGTAEIGSQSNIASSSDEVAAGFYAVAYDWNGQTIISYRGTDNLIDWTNLNPWSDTPGGDIWNSYLTGLGYTATSQAHLATEFYQAVTGTQTGDPTVPNITVVGHPSDCRATGGS